MPQSFSNVVMLGFVAKKPTRRFTSKGTPVTNISLGINYRNGKASFIPVTAWGRLAEVAYEHLGKGDAIVVIGRLQMDEWATSGGDKREKLVVVAGELSFQSPKKGGPDDAPPPDLHYQQDADGEVAF